MVTTEKFATMNKQKEVPLVRVITSDIQISSFLYVQLKKKALKELRLYFVY